ncbi:DUF4252 domain-containing protein [Aureivirga marina]|uniref:DUF4252 domain-containing protein n=1 Tax=Aureivirga marina TaxID=1182451 RepID=UPI0018C9B90A|nr:DUF4252 domain-containing protein [Aureivirga marina]
MKRLVGNFIWIFVLAFTIISCDSKPSLQKFFVENQNNENFIVLDVPSSTLINLSDDMTPEDKKTIESFRKINVLALQNENNKNEELYDSSKSKLNTIFKDENKYKPLIKSNSKFGSFDVYFQGKDDAIDEVIVYGYDKEKGLLVARVIGNDMNIGKITQIVNKIKPNEDGMKSLTGLFTKNFEIN